MRFQTLALLIILFSQFSFAQGRKPAVEDFVGIEVEHPESAPQGTENLFNFEKDMDQYQNTVTSPEQKISSTPKSTNNTNEFFRYIGVVLLLALPAVLSLLVMKRMKSKAREENEGNLKVLEEFRRQKTESKKSDEDIRKAS
jgi:hypothetical protein